MTGMPPATAASKDRISPCSSARAASRVPCMRHQRLVGGDDVLAVLERGLEQLAGDAVGAADQLDDDVDLGIGRHRRGILVPAHRREIDAAVAPPVARRYRGDDDAAAGALRQQIGLPVQQLQNAGANGAETGDGDLERRFHERATRMRCAKREAAASGARDRPFVALGRQFFDSVSRQRSGIGARAGSACRIAGGFGVSVRAAPRRGFRPQFRPAAPPRPGSCPTECPPWSRRRRPPGRGRERHDSCSAARRRRLPPPA